jgi:hypothetical protein
MIAAELAQRSFVELKKNLAQRLGFRMPGGETLPINLTQRVDGRVSVFVADFTVVVAVAIVETCVAHGALHCAYGELPPARTKWQSCAATGHQSRGLSHKPVDLGRSPARGRGRFRLMPMQRVRNMRHHRIAAVLANQHQALNRGFPLWQFALGFRQLDDVLRSVTSWRPWGSGSDRRTAAASHRDFCHESYLPST